MELRKTLPIVFIGQSHAKQIHGFVGKLLHGGVRLLNGFSAVDMKRHEVFPGKINAGQLKVGLRRLSRAAAVQQFTMRSIAEGRSAGRATG